MNYPEYLAERYKWICKYVTTNQWGLTESIRPDCINFFFDKLQSRKSQAGIQVQILDLEFSLETHFPTIHPPTHSPGNVFISYVGGRFLNKSCLSILVGIKMVIVTHGDLNMAHRSPKNGSKAFILWFCDRVKQNKSW